MPRHVLYLDLVRGLAAQAVLVGHAVLLGYPALIGREDFFYVQSWAVVVFLALSGYLIAGSVKRHLEKGTFTLSGYVKDRFARIFVPLLPLIPIVLIGDRLFLGTPPVSAFIAKVDNGVGAILTNLFLLQDNWVLQVVDRLFNADLSRRSLGSAAPWWTVALEWWIYLAFACLLALLLNSTKYRALALAVGLFALATTIGTTLSGNMLIGAWIVGAVLAWWSPELPRRSWAVIAAVSASGVVAFLLLLPGGVYSFPVVLGTSLGVLAAYQASTWNALRPARLAITFVAGYSYTLYLIHFPVLIWLAAAVSESDLDGMSFVLAGFLVANVVSILCWAGFERHFPRVRKWLDLRAGAAPNVATAAGSDCALEGARDRSSRPVSRPRSDGREGADSRHGRA